VKVPLHIVLARRDKLAKLIEQERYLPVKDLCKRLGVSEATARRDLAALVQDKRITRTYGGALSEFNDRFPSFRERRGQASPAKLKIARQALALIKAEGTYFFDSGTTLFAVAEALKEQPVVPVKIVTSNLPVAEILATVPGIQVFLLAGQLLHLQSTLLGEEAQKSLEFWEFDLALLSAEGMTSEGLWNSQAEIVAQQRVVLRRSRQNIFCLDSAKLEQSAPHFLAAWNEVGGLLTDATPARLAKAGIVVPSHSPAPPHVSQPEAGDFPVHIL
jgi:DeoR/GlpR family transcriptional regulator of sugar metabolism